MSNGSGAESERESPQEAPPEPPIKVVDNPFAPQGPEAVRMAEEHREEGHPSDPVELAYAAKCPLCYVEGLHD